MLYIGSVAAMGSFAGAEQSSVAGHPPSRVQLPKPPSPPPPPPDEEELDPDPEEELDCEPEDDPWDPDEEPVPPEEDPEPELLPELLLAPVLLDPAHPAMPQATRPSA
jgi:hypothetical protein